jgi:sulfur carrier protein ThiS
MVLYSVGRKILMKVQVKLFSIFRDYVPDYDPQKGVAADLPDGASVSDMLSHLDIPMSKVPVVICNGRILKATDTIQPDSILHIFQPVAGG